MGKHSLLCFPIQLKKRYANTYHPMGAKRTLFWLHRVNGTLWICITNTSYVFLAVYAKLGSQT